MSVRKLVGKLSLRRGRVILTVNRSIYYPVPFSAQMSINPNIAKAFAYSKYKRYLGKVVTIVGQFRSNKSGNVAAGKVLYDARVVRTRTKGEKPVEYGQEYWDNCVPKANILFRSRKLPGFDKHFQVDVRQMITINDSVIYKDLCDASLLVRNPDKCDDDIFAIYYHSRVKEINPYIYEYDNQAFGCEFFMYPYELRQLQKGDCDDWGIELASYLISAGVPAWRVRCVAGRTWQGGGHLTVYVLSDDLKTWRHLNSTTSWSTVKRRGYRALSDFPKPNDESDKIGIKDVWFSFNNFHAWHAFETYESEEDALSESWMAQMEITPLFDDI